MSEEVQQHVEVVAEALQQGAVPSALTPAIVKAIKSGLTATLDSVGADVRSLDFGSATPVIAMLAPIVIASAKAWITNFQYPKPVVPAPYPPQPGPYPPQPQPYPPQPGPAPQPYYPPVPPQPNPYPPQPAPQPQPYYPPQPQPPAPPRNGVDINVK